MSKNEGENEEKRGKIRKNTRKSGFLIKKVAEMFGGFVEMYYLCNRK